MHIDSIEQAIRFVNDHELAVIIFSTTGCSVCDPLKQKIQKIIAEKSLAVFAEISINQLPEASGEFGVFTAPTVLLYVDKKEAKRYSAAMDLSEFRYTIERFYNLLN